MLPTSIYQISHLFGDPTCFGKSNHAKVFNHCEQPLEDSWSNRSCCNYLGKCSLGISWVRRVCVQVVLKWPEIFRELPWLLPFANFYRRFINNSSTSPQTANFSSTQSQETIFNHQRVCLIAGRGPTFICGQYSPWQPWVHLESWVTQS